MDSRSFKILKHLLLLLHLASAIAAVVAQQSPSNGFVAPAPAPSVDLNKTLYPGDMAALNYLGVKYDAEDPCYSQKAAWPFVCDGSAGPHRIIALSLVNCSAGSKLSTELMRNLSALRQLSLENCPLAPESVPPEFGGSLKSLFSVSSLGRNLASPGLMKLSTSWLANLTSLVDLVISDVEIDSSGDGIFRITQKLQLLQTLDVTSTKLGGTLPRNTWPISVVHVDLSDNGISGTIPPEISQFTSIVHLDLSSNSISGKIPPEISLLSNLQHLDLSENAYIAGTIPSSIAVGTLPELRYIDLSGNLLTGTIPSLLTTLPHLYYLDLASNNISGPIPSGIASMKNLSYLDLSNNRLNGTIPANFTLLSNLTFLDLSSNDLTGELPFDDKFLKQLTDIRLSDNPGLCYNRSAVKTSAKLLQGVAGCEEATEVLAPAQGPSEASLPISSGSSHKLSKPAYLAIAAAIIAVSAAFFVCLVICCCRRRRRSKRRY